MTARQRDRFQFWRDLQPPFTVCQVHKADDGRTRHPDGDLHFVTYECGLDYNSERMWGMQQTAWTYDNKIHGVAEVRIPDNFPEKRPIKLISWGAPVLNWSPDDRKPEDRAPPPQSMALTGDRAAPPMVRGRTVKDAFPLPVTRRATIVQAPVHSPIAHELNIRPDHPRLAQVRETTRRCSISKNRKSIIEVPENLRESFPGLSEGFLTDFSESFPGLSKEAHNLPLLDARASRKKSLRKHIVFTSAGGFIDFDG